MTTSKIAHAFIAAAMVFLCAPGLYAEGAKVFVMGGGSTLSNSRYFTHNTVQYGSSYATGGRGTIGFETPISKVLGLEGAFAYGVNNFVISNYATNPVSRTSYGIKNLRYSGNLVGHSPATFRGWRPYVTAGIELDSFLVGDKAASTAAEEGFAGASTAILRSQDKVGFNFGGGLEWKITSRFNFRIDLRQHLTGSPTYALPATAPDISDPIFPITGTSRNLEYSMGIVYFIHK